MSQIIEFVSSSTLPILYANIITTSNKLLIWRQYTYDGSLFIILVITDFISKIRSLRLNLLILNFNSMCCKSHEWYNKDQLGMIYVNDVSWVPLIYPKIFSREQSF